MYLINLGASFEFQALLQVNENLKQSLGRKPTEGELAEATNMSIAQVKRHLEVGRAARNKLIKVNRTIFSTPLCIAYQKKCFYGFNSLNAGVALDAPLFQIWSLNQISLDIIKYAQN